MVENGYEIVQCPKCSFVYVWPRPHHAEISAFYRKHYAPESYDNVDTEWEQVALRRFSRHSSLITKRKSSGRERWLRLFGQNFVGDK